LGTRPVPRSATSFSINSLDHIVMLEMVAGAHLAAVLADDAHVERRVGRGVHLPGSTPPACHARSAGRL